MQVPAVRKQLLELHAMDFTVQQISLEAELQMNVSMPVSSTATTAIAESPGPQHAVSQAPSRLSCPSLPPSTQPETAPSTYTASLSSTKPASERAPHRQSTSRLRLPALPPGTARSPRIAAEYSGLGASGVPAKAPEAGLGGFKVPPGFVSSGDLEEDIQQLLEMDSEVLHPAAVHAVAAVAVLP